MITFVLYLKRMKNKKTLVLGATTKPDRYAFKAINMLVEKGHTVLAIGQNTGDVAGVKIQTQLAPFLFLWDLRNMIRKKSDPEFRFGLLSMFL